MEDLKRFLRLRKVRTFTGDCSGDGAGFGDCSGHGYGSGDGSGDGNGSGFGNGYGSGNGYGYCSGDGYGNGYGYCSGSGNIFGDGVGLKKHNGRPVHSIDGIDTIITSLRGNIAKGYIVKIDLTLTKCYVVKVNNMFAHGKTLRDAQDSLTAKINQAQPIEERIKNFHKEFKSAKKYSAKKFYDWHFILTGSCKMGRDNFMSNKGIRLKDKFTVDEFIELTIDQYGGDVIKRLTGL